MKYTEEQKIEMLQYAKVHGVVAAALHYDVDRRALAYWNKKLKIYKPKVASYDDATRRMVVEYAAAHGVRAATKQFKVSTEIIRIWNRELQVYGRKTNSFTEPQKLEILEYARDFGVFAAADKYAVHFSTICRWNKKYHVYDPQISFSPEQIIEMLTFARDNGLIAAAQRYDVADYTLERWNKEYKIYTPRQTKFVAYTATQQQEILRHALAVYKKLPVKSRSAHQAFLATAKDFPVSIDQLGVWNRKFRIVPTRPSGRRPLSDEAVAEIQHVLNTSRGSVGATARRTGYSELTVNNLIKSKRISFDKGRDIINKDMPVRQKKARIIGTILSGLLSRRKGE